MNIELNEIYWRRYKSDKSHGQTWLSLLIDYNPTKHWEDSFKKIIFNIWSFLDTIYNTHVAHLVKLPSMLDFVKKINIIMIVTRILLISLASSSYGVKSAPEMSTLFRLQWLYFFIIIGLIPITKFLLNCICWKTSRDFSHDWYTAGSSDFSLMEAIFAYVKTKLWNSKWNLIRLVNNY